MMNTPTRSTILISVVAVLVAALPAGFTASQGPPAAVSQTSDTDKQLATIKQYCAACHNDRAKIAGVSFEGSPPESIGQHADVFEKAVRKLRGRVMPPPGARQPDGRGRRLAGRVARGSRSIARPSQAHVPRPGRPAPAQSQGIRERGPRSAGGRLRRRARCCRRTTWPRASTTSRRRCRCRRRSSSSTSSPRAPWR